MSNINVFSPNIIKDSEDGGIQVPEVDAQVQTQPKQDFEVGILEGGIQLSETSAMMSKVDASRTNRITTPSLLSLTFTVPSGIPDDDITNPTAYRTVDYLVGRLMSPPKRCFNAKLTAMTQWGMVNIDMMFVQSICRSHLEINTTLGRLVLKGNSKIRTHGQLAGLPAGYYNRLCGRADPVVGGSGTKHPDELKVFWMLASEFHNWKVRSCISKLNLYRTDVFSCSTRTRTEWEGRGVGAAEQ